MNRKQTNGSRVKRRRTNKRQVIGSQVHHHRRNLCPGKKVVQGKMIIIHCIKQLYYFIEIKKSDFGSLCSLVLGVGVKWSQGSTFEPWKRVSEWFQKFRNSYVESNRVHNTLKLCSLPVYHIEKSYIVFHGYCPQNAFEILYLVFHSLFSML